MSGCKSPNSIYIRALCRPKTSSAFLLTLTNKTQKEANHTNDDETFQSMLLLCFQWRKKLFQCTWLSWVVHKGHWIKRFILQTTSLQTFKQTTKGHMYKHREQRAWVTDTLSCSVLTVTGLAVSFQPKRTPPKIYRLCFQQLKHKKHININEQHTKSKLFCQLKPHSTQLQFVCLLLLLSNIYILFSLLGLFFFIDFYSPM